LVILRSASEEFDQSYLRWVTRGPLWEAEVRRLTNVGAVFESLNVRDIARIRVPVPPVADQIAIAEVLCALDDKIAINERIAETSLALAKARTEAAPPAAPVRLGDMAKVFDGPHATPRKTNEGPWFLSISSLKGGIFDLGESAHLAEEDFPRWTRRVQPREGDVLFSYETRLGEAALMPPGVRASLGRRMGLLRPKPGTVDSAMLLHAYLGPSFQAEIRRRTVHGATVDRIPLKEMPTWPITLPSYDVRPQLSAALEALHASINQAAVENRTLAALRDTLLPQLVTGKIRVKEAERAVEDATS
jgi:type I restriction enzyme S subunit